MTQNISVPDIGDFDSVEIIEVLIKVGDQINKDDPIVTLESDKSSVEVPSPIAGIITELNIKVGDKVSSGSLLCKIESHESNLDQKKESKKNVILTEEKNIKKINSENIPIVKSVKKSLDQPSSKDDVDPLETKEWIESLNAVIENDGPSRASFILSKVVSEAYTAGLSLPDTRTTPYINTIPTELEVKSPGNQNIEKKIRAYVRWNAAAMVVRANKVSSELGGHIGTFASAATLYDVGMNHFWRAKNKDFGGDLIYFQGHSAPGMYARAFLEEDFQKNN
jgi:pyruvate dehydrogenase E1 component